MKKFNDYLENVSEMFSNELPIDSKEIKNKERNDKEKNSLNTYLNKIKNTKLSKYDLSKLKYSKVRLEGKSNKITFSKIKDNIDFLTQLVKEKKLKDYLLENDFHDFNIKTNDIFFGKINLYFNTYFESQLNKTEALDLHWFWHDNFGNIFSFHHNTKNLNILWKLLEKPSLKLTRSGVGALIYLTIGNPKGKTMHHSGRTLPWNPMSLEEVINDINNYCSLIPSVKKYFKNKSEFNLIWKWILKLEKGYSKIHKKENEKELNQEDMLRARLNDLINSNSNNKRGSKLKTIQDSFETEVIDKEKDFDDWKEANFTDDNVWVGYEAKKAEKENLKKLKDEKIQKIGQNYEALNRLIEKAKEGDAGYLKNTLQNQGNDPTKKDMIDYLKKAIAEAGIKI